MIRCCPIMLLDNEAYPNVYIVVELAKFMLNQILIMLYCHNVELD